jgi:hypothetical protein
MGAGHGQLPPRISITRDYRTFEDQRLGFQNAGKPHPSDGTRQKQNAHDHPNLGTSIHRFFYDN